MPTPNNRNTRQENAYPPVHPNCVCEIVDGVWQLGQSASGPCPICEQMAALYNMGSRSADLDVMKKISKCLHAHADGYKGFQRALYRGTLQEIIEDQRADISIISSDTLDSHRTIFDPDGMDWSEFLGPIGGGVHVQHTGMKIGRCAWVKPYQMNGKRGFIAKTIYDNSIPGNMAYDALKSGGFQGKSIGFLPIETRAPSSAEKTKYPKLEEVISKCYIYEYSMVMEPSNPDAKVMVRDKPVQEPEKPDFESLILARIDVKQLVRQAINRAMGRSSKR